MKCFSRFLLGIAALLLAPQLPAAQEGALNIVFLESDDHHYQALGCLGDPVSTPNLDALAARGLLFRNNVCQGTACAPSRNSLLTGSYPHNTGVYHNQDSNFTEPLWTFPAALQRAGYTTALVGKNHFKPHSEYTGRPADKPYELQLRETHALGFDHVHSISGKVSVATSKADPSEDPYRAYLQEKGLLTAFEEYYDEHYADARSGPPVAAMLKEDDSQDAYIATKAIEYLASDHSGKPFFLWVDFVHPHPPADPVEPYLSQYDWETMREPLPRANPDEPLRGLAKHRTEETYKRFRAGYYAMITALDTQVGRIVDALEANGQLENTLIVFAGDQGSMLGDLGFWGKGEFYKGSINSPLVMAGPEHFQQGKVIDRPVQLLDLAPTFLELAGASEEDRQQCFGESMAPLLTGEGDYLRAVAYAEEYTSKMATTSEYKLVRNEEGEDQLFDLVNDPNELKNIIGSLPVIEAEMNQLLDDWLARTGPIREPNPRPSRKKSK